MTYTTMSTYDLVKNYIWEKDRKNEEDKRLTQELIKRELSIRFQYALEALNEDYRDAEDIMRILLKDSKY